MRTRRNQVLAKPADTNVPADTGPWEEALGPTFG